MDLEELLQVRVSPFDVSTQLDSVYRASNSVSGSRFDTPIRDLPFAIQAFTESFIKGQKPRDIFDIARYSPGVTYRSNDFNESNANVAIRGFTFGSLPGGNIDILRDGVHGPSIFGFTLRGKQLALKPCTRRDEGLRLHDQLGSWRIIPATVLLYAVLLPVLATSQNLAMENPNKVKAAFLRNFAHYIIWPENAFPDRHSPWHIGILGQDPFGDALEVTLKDQTEQDRPFKVYGYIQATG